MSQAEWHSRYTAALFEPDRSKLRSRINETETAISSRIQNLAEDSDSNDEQEIISNAQSSLHALQRNLLRYR
jgi:hypothetical protein